MFPLENLARKGLTTDEMPSRHRLLNSNFIEKCMDLVQPD